MEKRSFNQVGFRAFMDENKLMATRCQSCQAVYLPPRGMCPHCFSSLMEWVELSGEGELVGYTTIFVGLPEMKAEGYNKDNPYSSGVVKLKEGPLICGQILARETELSVGMEVKAVFMKIGASTRLGFENHKEG
jgi:uncharacterized OB-fold protein